MGVRDTTAGGVPGWGSSEELGRAGSEGLDLGGAIRISRSGRRARWWRRPGRSLCLGIFVGMQRSVAPFWVSRLSFPHSGPSVPLSLPLMPPSLSFAARTLRPPLCAHLLLPPLLFPTSLLCASLITPLTSYEFSAVLSFP